MTEQDYTNYLRLVVRKKNNLGYSYRSQEVKTPGFLLHATYEIMIEVNEANFSPSC